MERPKRGRLREERIHNEAIVDAGSDEQAIDWYYRLESKIGLPFQTKCLAKKFVSPFRNGETVEVLVLVRWHGRTMAARPFHSPLTRQQPETFRNWNFLARTTTRRTAPRYATIDSAYRWHRNYRRDEGKTTGVRRTLERFGDCPSPFFRC